LKGWGMTNDGKETSTNLTEQKKIWKMDPGNTKKMVDFINVYKMTKKIQSINELEWITANLWWLLSGKRYYRT